MMALRNFGKLSRSFHIFVCLLGEKFLIFASHSCSRPTRFRTIEEYEHCLLNEIEYLSNRPHFLWVYRRDNPRGMLGEHEKSGVDGFLLTIPSQKLKKKKNCGVYCLCFRFCLYKRSPQFSEWDVQEVSPQLCKE